MSTDLATREQGMEAIERLIVAGDLSKLSPEQRVTYYMKRCEKVGLDPLSRPFDYLTLNGKLVLYANKEATAQLRAKHGISITKPEVQFEEGLCVVAVTASLPDGRTDSELGVVTIEGLKGDARANAILKAITKGKRRVTLSIVGLGMLDEFEVETIPHAAPVAVDHETGVILEAPSNNGDDQAEPPVQGAIVPMPSEEGQALFLNHEKALKEAKTVTALQEAWSAILRDGGHSLLTRDQVGSLTKTKDAQKGVVAAKA